MYKIANFLFGKESKQALKAYELGKAYAKSNQFEKALAEFEKVLNIVPNCVSAKYKIIEINKHLQNNGNPLSIKTEHKNTLP